jgi:hypothetical protein
VTTPGFFELYPSARPALPAGAYTATSEQTLIAQTPHDGDVTVPVTDTEFHLDVVAPRYVMPPDQILSTFPPATSQGDWRERLPQIVLKRRTLPWERNPTNPETDPHTAPPWLALVVLADGEGRLSTDTDVAQCVTPGVDLGDEADVPRGKYLEVRQSIVDKVFPCLDELDLLCHVRKVDLADTELALGDDDGFLAVVLSNRLPQPAAPKTADADATPLKYAAYLINLEHQLDTLLATEPDPVLFFNSFEATALVDQEFLAPAPNATLDQIAMGIGAAQVQLGKDTARKALAAESTALAPYGTSFGLEPAAASWATGPGRTVAIASDDLATARSYKAGLNDGVLFTLDPVLRYPVLASWEFTCTGEGGFERLMNKLEVGLLGTVDAATATTTPLQVAATGHIALSHRTRQGEEDTAWYRGPLSPQPTVRTTAVNGVLPLANTGDQLRKLVPDGTEDLSLAALFEIGRLLTLNKPTLIASLMAWRAELFGAARAREIADALTASIIKDIGVSAAGKRNALEDLVRTHVVGALTALDSDALAPSAPLVTQARRPSDLVDLGPEQVLTGLGADPKSVLVAGKNFGVDGLGTVSVPVTEANDAPVSQDQRAMSVLTMRLGARVDDLVISALKFDPAGPPTPAGPKGEAAPPKPRRSRKKDEIDRMIAAAEQRRTPAGSSTPRRKG